MLTKDFEKQLQDNVDKSINFREHAVNKDILGIYYGDVYTETAIPANEIQEERSENYLDNFGTPHRGSLEAEARITDFVHRYTTEPVFRELYEN